MQEVERKGGWDQALRNNTKSGKGERNSPAICEQATKEPLKLIRLIDISDQLLEPRANEQMSYRLRDTDTAIELGPSDHSRLHDGKNYNYETGQPLGSPV